MKERFSRRKFLKMAFMLSAGLGTGLPLVSSGSKSQEISIDNFVNPDSPLLGTEKIRGGLTISAFGPFWKHEINPAQVALEIMQRENLIPGAIYLRDLPVTWQQTASLIELESNIFQPGLNVIMSVGGDSKNIVIETSAGNRMPVTYLEDVGFNDPYRHVGVDSLKLYPNEPLDYVRRISPDLEKKVKDVIGKLALRGVKLGDSGPDRTVNTPCNAAAYAALRATAGQALLVHLPYSEELDRELIRQSTEKISLLLQEIM